MKITQLISKLFSVNHPQSKSQLSQERNGGNVEEKFSEGAITKNSLDSAKQEVGNGAGANKL